MIMKWFLIIVLLMSSFSYSADSFGVELSRYEPFPAESGKILTAWVRIHNTGFDTIEEVNIEADAEYPLRFLEEEGTRVYRDLAVSDSILIKYRLSVDKAGPDGDAILKIITYGKDEFIKSVHELNVTVENPNDETELKAIFDEVTPLPGPGSFVNLSIDIINRDHGIAYFTLVEASTEIGTIQKNVIAVGNQDPDDFDSAVFQIRINDNIAPGRYPVNIKFSSKDADGIEKESLDVVYLDIFSIDEANAAQGGGSIFDYLIIIIILLLAYKYVILPRKNKIIELKKKLL